MILNNKNETKESMHMSVHDRIEIAALKAQLREASRIECELTGLTDVEADAISEQILDWRQDIATINEKYSHDGDDELAAVYRY